MSTDLLQWVAILALAVAHFLLWLDVRDMRR